MTKSCKNCQANFIIEPDDVAFYERIAVSPPTFCPQCRFQRRMSWRNGWHLFKNKDARDGKELFSFFPPESKIPVYDRDFWFSDGWDPIAYGRDYDFSRPFFEQFGEFIRVVPEPAHSSLNLVNCRFCMNLADGKNCYLVRGGTMTEDSAYLVWDHGSKQCMDGHMTDHCDLCYGSVNIEHCYKTHFSVDCDTCHNLVLSKDCVGCNDCIGCFGLRKKSYCIFNQQYTKDEYVKKLDAINLGSYQGFLEVRDKAYAFWKTQPHKFMHGLKNVNVSGDYIYESKNAKQCYRVRGTEDCKYTQNILEKSAKDCYDFSNFGEGAELCYETLISGRGASNIKFCAQVYLNCKNVEYSIFCRNVSDCFACISVRDKQYCIFNKQYDKSSFDKLRTQIIAQMTNDKEYGEFFPANMSPFSYRVSEAYEFFPLTETEAKERGFAWYDIAHTEHKATLPSSRLPDHIKDASDDLLKEIIGCAHSTSSGQAPACDQECTGAFRIIPEELTFLRRMHIPLPRLCPNCRLYERFTLRNPPIFYHRQCAKCSADIETSYAPDRPEKIYCETCYQQEVV